ncbi:uncharacterized protein LOC126740579 [Anthonomus grandis grandis]|uniref:uncharacterized protein LOC126740579 n=1 Tax=Anthonomus grandis grandis TaxID=2921223 RepID=UPI0021658F2F|nr:uncharacterized protein LOC126740579 [Anthonomus grandis grandis]
MKLFNIILILTLCNIFNVYSSEKHGISKRSYYLLFPRNTIFQFTYGLTVPVILPRRSINISWCFQAQYNLPYNISNFYPTTVAVRSGGLGVDLARIKFYEYLAMMLDNFGLHGENCVLRSVCEVAEIPMYEKEDSVLEKIVHFLFTPSLELNLNETNRALENSKFKTLTQKLLKAEDYGKTQGECEIKYSKCIMSIVDLMTVLYFT